MASQINLWSVLLFVIAGLVFWASLRWRRKPDPGRCPAGCFRVTE